MKNEQNKPEKTNLNNLKEKIITYELNHFKEIFEKEIDKFIEERIDDLEIKIVNIGDHAIDSVSEELKKDFKLLMDKESQKIKKELEQIIDNNINKHLEKHLVKKESIFEKILSSIY